jgi:hypothetical protein
MRRVIIITSPQHFVGREVEEWDIYLGTVKIRAIARKTSQIRALGHVMIQTHI